MHFQKITHPYQGRNKLVECISVARVQPRTSKGITDLLLLNLVRLDAASPSKKNVYRKRDGKPI